MFVERTFPSGCLNVIRLPCWSPTHLKRIAHASRQGRVNKLQLRMQPKHLKNRRQAENRRYLLAAPFLQPSASTTTSLWTRSDSSE